MVELLAVNEKVLGSNPSRGEFYVFHEKYCYYNKYPPPIPIPLTKTISYYILCLLILVYLNIMETEELVVRLPKLSARETEATRYGVPTDSSWDTISRARIRYEEIAKENPTIDDSKEVNQTPIDDSKPY